MIIINGRISTEKANRLTIETSPSLSLYGGSLSLVDMFDAKRYCTGLKVMKDKELRV